MNADRDDDVRAILRRLHGRADARIEAGPHRAEVEATWRLLQDPGPLSPPPGFASGIVGRLEREPPPGLFALAQAPFGVRAVAAAALVAGIGAGVGFGAWVQPTAPTWEHPHTVAEEAEWVVGVTLAETWFDLAEEGS